MKIKNIFKKNKKNITQTNVQVLDKKHLEKVIGGSSIARDKFNPNTESQK
jgi:hypothetical protein